MSGGRSTRLFWLALAPTAATTSDTAVEYIGGASFV
jgi:hypothetical protein